MGMFSSKPPPTLLIFEQVQPEIERRFRVAEVMQTIDGARTRLTNACFPTLEEAKDYVKRESQWW